MSILLIHDAVPGVFWGAVASAHRTLCMDAVPRLLNVPRNTNPTSFGPVVRRVGLGGGRCGVWVRGDWAYIYVFAEWVLFISYRPDSFTVPILAVLEQ